MANTTKKVMREEMDRLKKMLDKILKPGKQPALPQLALQPVRNKKYFGATSPH
jgi:hypothetical protein